MFFSTSKNITPDRRLKLGRNDGVFLLSGRNRSKNNIIWCGSAKLTRVVHVSRAVCSNIGFTKRDGRVYTKSRQIIVLVTGDYLGKPLFRNLTEFLDSRGFRNINFLDDSAWIYVLNSDKCVWELRGTERMDMFMCELNSKYYGIL